MIAWRIHCMATAAPSRGSRSAAVSAGRAGAPCDGRPVVTFGGYSAREEEVVLL